MDIRSRVKFEDTLNGMHCFCIKLRENENENHSKVSSLVKYANPSDNSVIKVFLCLFKDTYKVISLERNIIKTIFSFKNNSKLEIHIMAGLGNRIILAQKIIELFICNSED